MPLLVAADWSKLDSADGFARSSDIADLYRDLPMRTDTCLAPLSRAISGAKWGITAGAALSIVAIIPFTLNAERTVAKYQTGIGPVIISYLIGGVLGGAIVGLLFPLTRWRAGAIAVGIISFAPISAGICFVMYGTSGWKGATLFSFIVGSLTLGSIVGYNIYKWNQEEAADHHNGLPRQ